MPLLKGAKNFTYGDGIPNYHIPENLRPKRNREDLTYKPYETDDDNYPYYADDEGGYDSDTSSNFSGYGFYPENERAFLSLYGFNYVSPVEKKEEYYNLDPEDENIVESKDIVENEDIKNNLRNDAPQHTPPPLPDDFIPKYDYNKYSPINTCKSEKSPYLNFIPLSSSVHNTERTNRVEKTNDPNPPSYSSSSYSAVIPTPEGYIDQEEVQYNYSNNYYDKD